MLFIAPTHAAGYRQLPHAELAACCDLIPERAEKLAREYAIARVYTDHKARLLAGERDKLADHAAQFQNVVDLLADDVAAGDVGIDRDGAGPSVRKGVEFAVPAFPAAADAPAAFVDVASVRAEPALHAFVEGGVEPGLRHSADSSTTSV